jgi:hypothetical protein
MSEINQLKSQKGKGALRCKLRGMVLPIACPIKIEKPQLGIRMRDTGQTTPNQLKKPTQRPAFK